MARKTPRVWVAFSGTVTQAEVDIPAGTARAIRLESTLWWAWLATATARSFAYPIYDAQVSYIRGFMTVRKEQRARGSEPSGRRTTVQDLSGTLGRTHAAAVSRHSGAIPDHGSTSRCGTKGGDAGAVERRIVRMGGDAASREVKSPGSTAWPTMTRVVQLGRP